MSAFQRDRWLSMGLAAVFHLVLIFGSAKMLFSQAQFGVDAGSGGIAVNLVAAPAPPETPQIVIPKQEEKIPPVEMPKEPEEDVLKIPEPPKAVEKTVPLQKQTVIPKLTAVGGTGDGSSAVPGKDKITFQSGGGATAEAKPNYLSNPPPEYPENARRLRQEGLVLLLAEVTREGRVQSLEIKKGSGFRLLDNAAFKAVKNWKFHPARLGTVAIDSRVEVPIRFKMNSK